MFQQILTIIIFASQLSSTINDYQAAVLGARIVEFEPRKIAAEVNSERETLSIEKLKDSSALNSSTLLRVNEMCNENYIGHRTRAGRSWEDTIVKSGYKGSLVGENIAYDFDTSAKMIETWMGSPTHRANIVNPQYNETGISTKRCQINGRMTTIVVQHFGG